MKLLLATAILGLLVSCGKNEVGTNLVNASKGFVKITGKSIEYIAQQPKHFFREILGVNKDKTESDSNYNYIHKELNQLRSLINNTEVNQDQLEQEIALLNQKIVELESNDSIVEFIDPCGDNPNQFDEILMVTSNGSYIAYFQQGSRRFLTSLPNGSYTTTDNQSCNFSIVNGEYVE